jgi:hypothetical protein
MLHTCLADTVFPCRHCSSHKDERERKKLWRQRKKKKTKTVKIFISWGTLSHDSFPFHSNRHTPHRGPGPFAAAWRRPSRPCRRAETRPSFPAVEAFFSCFFAGEERSRGGGEVREEKYETKKRTFPPFSLEGKHRKISSSALPQRRDRRSGRASSPGARRGRGRADYYFLVGGERFGKRSKVEKNGKEKTSRNQSPLFSTKATFSSSFPYRRDKQWSPCCWSESSGAKIGIPGMRGGNRCRARRGASRRRRRRQRVWHRLRQRCCRARHRSTAARSAWSAARRQRRREAAGHARHLR